MWRNWQENPLVVGMVGGFLMVAAVNVLEAVGGWLRSRGIPPAPKEWG